MHNSHLILHRVDEVNDVDIKAAQKEPLSASQLQARYLQSVFEYVARRVPNREEAEDIASEVFAAAFLELPRFRYRCSPRVWLLGIARRRIVNSYRRNKSRPPALSQIRHLADEVLLPVESMGVPHEEPSTAAERNEAKQAIRDLLNGVKEEQREALLLQHAEGLAINEIAVVMKRSPKAVNSLLQRARKTMYERGKEYFLD